MQKNNLSIKVDQITYEMIQEIKEFHDYPSNLYTVKQIAKTEMKKIKRAKNDK